MDSKQKKPVEEIVVKPSVVESQGRNVILNEFNTVSGLSELQTQFNTNNNWLFINERIMLDNEATLNMVERYVKNEMFKNLNLFPCWK